MYQTVAPPLRQQRGTVDVHRPELATRKRRKRRESGFDLH